MQNRGRLWRIAFIAGMICYSLVTFYTLFATKLIADTSHLPFFLLPLIIAAILLISVIIAIKWTLVSGILLVIESLLLTFWTIFLAEKPDFFNLALFLPALIVGVLFLISRFKERAREPGTRPR